MPEKLTELFDIVWQETSFVPAGDNPLARIVMWKHRSSPGLTDSEIEEVLRGVETERRAEMPTLTKRSDVEAYVTRLAKQKHPNLGEAAGRARIWAERPDLREAHERAQAEEVAPASLQAPASLEKGAQALAKRDAAVRELRKLYPHESEASLRVRALREDPRSTRSTGGSRARRSVTRGRWFWALRGRPGNASYRGSPTPHRSRGRLGCVVGYERSA